MEVLLQYCIYLLDQNKFFLAESASYIMKSRKVEHAAHHKTTGALHQVLYRTNYHPVASAQAVQ